jgi:methionyl-tRNA formyltransferase
MVEMRAVFLGTPEFALPSLRTLTESDYEVCAVFSQPDRPAGRGQKLHPTPIKQFAQSLGIPVYQPERMRDEENRARLSGFEPDFIVVAAYGQILPTWLLKLPRVAPVNVHASLLPRYRGAAPVAWAILNGDITTGVTTMLIEEKLDTGPILLSREVPISPTVTTGELMHQLAELGARLLPTTLDGLRNGSIIPIPQDESKASLAPRIRKEMALIDWTEDAPRIHNRVRALNPWPVAATYFQQQALKILRSFPLTDRSAYEAAPGTLLDVVEQGLRVQCGNGTVLDVLEVQVPGRQRVSGREFANGARLRPGVLLFSTSPL